jgi:predicted aspartyl protease
MTRLLVAATTVTALVLCLAPIAPAQIYRWTDEQGRVNFSQGLDSVPERFRSGAQFVNTPAAPPTVAPLIPSGRVTGAVVAGGGQIRFTPGQAILVNARINDSGSVKLLLDTGASVTTINPRLLAQLGVSSRDAVRGSIRGVTGQADTLFVVVNSIDVNGAKTGPIRVVAHDVDRGQSDGLLGRDYLDRFQVSIDNQAGIVTLTPR